MQIVNEYVRSLEALTYSKGLIGLSEEDLKEAVSNKNEIGINTLVERGILKPNEEIKLEASDICEDNISYIKLDCSNNLVYTFKGNSFNIYVIDVFDGEYNEDKGLRVKLVYLYKKALLISKDMFILNVKDGVIEYIGSEDILDNKIQIR